MPKVMQTQFYLPPGKAALLFGVIAIPCAFSGNLIGKKKKENKEKNTIPKCWVAGISLPTVCVFIDYFEVT